MAAYSGILQLAKDQDTPVPEKLKLLKFAWAKPEVTIPNKYQEILDLVCALIVNKEGLKGEDDFLVWQCLLKLLTASQSTVAVSSSISKVVTERILAHVKAKSRSKEKDSKCFPLILECGSLLLSIRAVQLSSFSDTCEQLSAVLQLSLLDDENVEKAQAFVKSAVTALANQETTLHDQKEIISCVVDLMPYIMKYQTVYADPNLQDFLLTTMFHRIQKEITESLIKVHYRKKVPHPVYMITYMEDIFKALFNEASVYLVSSFLPAFLEEFLKHKSADSHRGFLILQFAVQVMLKDGDSSQEMRLSCVDKCFRTCVDLGSDPFATELQQQGTEWVQQVLDFVLPLHNNPAWYSFMSSLLILRPAMIDRCLARILTAAMALVEGEYKDVGTARDGFLSELINVFLKLRRIPYFHQCLVQVVSSGKSIPVNSPSLQKFKQQLCMMFHQVPIISVTTIWNEIKTQLESTIPAPSMGESKGRAVKQSWLLFLLNSLLSHTQFFDQRSMGMMEEKLHSLLEVTEYNVLKPLAKEYNSDEIPALLDVLITWAYLKMLLYPKWRERAGIGAKQEGEDGEKGTMKLIKKVSLPTKIRLILQRRQVLTSGDKSKGDNYQKSCEEVNGLVAELLESVTALIKDSNGGNGQQVTVLFQEFFEIFPLMGHCLTDALIKSWAAVIIENVVKGSGRSSDDDDVNWSTSTFYPELERFLHHPATMENQQLQTHLACLIWSELLTLKSGGSPKKMKKRQSMTSGDLDAVSRMYQFITDVKMESADFVVNPDEIAGTLGVAEPINPNLIQMLSSLSIEFLPLLCLKSQLGLFAMAACLPSAPSAGKDKVAKLVESNLIQCLSGKDLAPFFSCITPDKFLQFSLNLSSQPFNTSHQFLECCTTVVMNKYNQPAILSIRPVVKQLAREMYSDGDVDSIERHIFAMSTLIHSYRQYNIFKVKGAASAAKEIFFVLSKVVFDNAEGWVKRQENTHLNDISVSKKKKESDKVLQKAGKKRKLSAAEDDMSMEIDQSKTGSASAQADDNLFCQAVSCVTEILMVWMRENSTEEMNQQLAGIISVIYERLMERDNLSVGQLCGQQYRTNLLRLNFMKAVCKCQKRLALGSASSPNVDKSTSKTPSSTTQQSPVSKLFLDDKGILDFWQNIFTLATSELSTLISSTYRGDRQILKDDNAVISHNTTTVSKTANDGKGQKRENGGEREQITVATGFVVEEVESWPKSLTLCLDILSDMGIGAMGDKSNRRERGKDKVFVELLGSLMEHLNSPSESNVPSVIISLAIWRRLATSSFLINLRANQMLDQIYQVLERCSSLLQHLNHDGANSARKAATTLSTNPTALPKSSSESEGDDLNAAVCRFIVRSLEKFMGFAKETNHPASIIVCLQLAPMLSLSCPADIRALQLPVNAFLFFHPRSAVAAISTVLALVSKLVCSCVRLANQTRLSGRGPEELEELVDSAKLVSRVLVCLTEGVVKEEVEKFGHCVIFDYIMELQKGALHPKVKQELLAGLYQLLSVCRHSCLAALNAALPSEVKETFKFMHQEYMKFYKYRRTV